MFEVRETYAKSQNDCVKISRRNPSLHFLQRTKNVQPSLSASILVEQSQSISPQSRSQSRPTNPLARKRGTSQFPVLESRHFSRRSSHQGVFELLLKTMSATPRYAYWFRFRSEVAEARETYFPRFAPSAVHFFLCRSRSYFSKRWLLFFQRLWGCSAPISNLLPGRVRPKKESNNIIPFGI